MYIIRSKLLGDAAYRLHALRAALEHGVQQVHVISEDLTGLSPPRALCILLQHLRKARSMAGRSGRHKQTPEIQRLGHQGPGPG